MPDQSLPPSEGWPVLHCATHEKPFPCPDCVAARSPEQSLPEGVERYEQHMDHGMLPLPSGRWFKVADLSKIIDQAKQEERERIEAEQEIGYGAALEAAEAASAHRERERVREALQDALDLIERLRGGDEKLTSEEYYARRDRLRADLAALDTLED